MNQEFDELKQIASKHNVRMTQCYEPYAPISTSKPMKLPLLPKRVTFVTSTPMTRTNVQTRPHYRAMPVTAPTHVGVGHYRLRSPPRLLSSVDYSRIIGVASRVPPHTRDHMHSRDRHDDYATTRHSEDVTKWQLQDTLAKMTESVHNLQKDSESVASSRWRPRKRSEHTFEIKKQNESLSITHEHRTAVAVPKHKRKQNTKATQTDHDPHIRASVNMRMMAKRRQDMRALKEHCRELDKAHKAIVSELHTLTQELKDRDSLIDRLRLELKTLRKTKPKQRERERDKERQNEKELKHRQLSKQIASYKLRTTQRKVLTRSAAHGTSREYL